MNIYDVYIEDIYDRERNKKITVKDINAYVAHKKGLSHTNALREEISKIVMNGKTVYTFKGGFLEE